MSRFYYKSYIFRHRFREVLEMGNLFLTLFSFCGFPFFSYIGSIVGGSSYRNAIQAWKGVRRVEDRLRHLSLRVWTR